MTHISLKDRLLRWLRSNPEYIASGSIQRMVASKTSYSPQNVGRRLRELHTEGLIEVEYRLGHAYYRAKQFVNLNLSPISADKLFESI